MVSAQDGGRYAASCVLGETWGGSSSLHYLTGQQPNVTLRVGRGWERDTVASPRLHEESVHGGAGNSPNVQDPAPMVQNGVFMLCCGSCEDWRAGSCHPWVWFRSSSLGGLWGMSLCSGTSPGMQGWIEEGGIGGSRKMLLMPFSHH